MASNILMNIDTNIYLYVNIYKYFFFFFLNVNVEIYKNIKKIFLSVCVYKLIFVLKYKFLCIIKFFFMHTYTSIYSIYLFIYIYTH